MNSNFIDFNIKSNNFYIYSRVSSNKQNDDANGLDYQDLICETYTKEIFKIDTDVINYYCDIQSSYKTLSKLKDLHLMINDITTNSVIMISEVSRIGRNIHQVLPLLSKIKEKNCWIISISESLCFNINKLMDKQFYQKVIDAEKESDLISIRTSNSNKFIKSIGGHIGSIPYGKKRVKVNGVPILVNCDEESQILDKINELDKENKDINTIVEYLNKNDIKKRKYSWTHNSVKNIISTKQKNNFDDMNNNIKKIKLF